jgi:hypothetical protein
MGHVAETHPQGRRETDKAALPSSGTLRGLRIVVAVLGAGFAIGYAIQAATPLRLNTDAVTFLEMAASATDGHGFPKTRYPPGYPAIVSGLERIGAATSAGLVACNIAATAAALAAFFWIFTRRLRLSTEASAAICLVSAASWVWIKHVTLPLSDMPFLGVSAVAILLITMAETEHGLRRTGLLSGAAICCALAVLLRTIGIALVPALIWAASGRGVLKWLRSKPWLAASSAALMATIAIVGFIRLWHTEYFQNFLSVGEREGVVGMLVRNLGWRLDEFGEMTVNVPQFKAPESMHAAFTIVGAAILALCAGGLVCRRKFVSSTEIYLAAFAAILFVWPWYDPRFWLPVIPLLAAYVWMGATRIADQWPTFRNRATLFLCLPLAVFLLLGIVSLAYSTRITFAGEKFPERYGNGKAIDTYRAALGQPHDPAKVSLEELMLLKRYGQFEGR